MDYDAIVVGAGHNGLACALYLADAGWRVLVLERSAEIGGTVRTGEMTLPGFKHDLFATNVNQFAASAVYRDFRQELEGAGLRLLTSAFPYASAYQNGSAVRVYTDSGLTEREIGSHSSEDLVGWQSAVGLFKRTASAFLPLFRTEVPSAEMMRHLARLCRRPSDAIRLTRLLAQSVRQFVDQHFLSPEVRGLVAAWGFHVDCAPDVRASAVLAYLPAMAAFLHGAAVAEAGAGRITEALRTLIERRGGEIQTGSEVSRVIVRQGRAVGVETRDGRNMTATRAIIASVAPSILFGSLVPNDELPPGFVRRVRRYRYAPGTFVVHLAFDRALEWRATEDLSRFVYVHLCGGVEELCRTYDQCMSGKLPTHPLLVISQMTPIDPSRAPPGYHVARIHARAVPYEIASDAADKIQSRDWDEVKEAYADRLVDLLADHAPNVKQALLARSAVSPLDLERGNPNLVRGDCVSGSHHIDQNYFLRPIAGWSRYATPIRQLYIIGASTWPGGGVNGGSGYLAARKLLESR